MTEENPSSCIQAEDTRRPALTAKASHFSQGETHAWLHFLAHFLFILAAWTMVIKYLFPMAYALAHDEALTQYIFWDFWPVFHVWVGWALLARPPYVYSLSLVMSLVEIVIIVTFFTLFLAEPDWTIWRTNWFINKVFVLGCFILLLATVICSPGILKGQRS